VIPRLGFIGVHLRSSAANKVFTPPYYLQLKPFLIIILHIKLNKTTNARIKH